MTLTYELSRREQNFSFSLFDAAYLTTRKGQQVKLLGFDYWRACMHFETVQREG